MTQSSPAPLPAGLTLEEQDGGLRICYRDRSVGVSLLMLSILIAATVLAYSFSPGVVVRPIEALVVAAVCVPLTALAFALIVNSRILTLSGNELVAATTPIPFSAAKRLPVGEVSDWEVFEKQRRDSHIYSHFQLYAIHASLGRVRLINFRRNKAAADLVRALLSDRSETQK